MLNIKLSKTPPLPTHLGGGPTPGAICGLWRVTWKHPPAPHTPRAKYLRGWGRRLSPEEVLRSNLLQPLVTRAEKVYLGLLSAPASPPLRRLPLQWLPDPPPQAPHHSDTQSPAPVLTLTDLGHSHVPCVQVGRIHISTPPPYTTRPGCPGSELWTKKPETGSTVTWPPAPGNLSPYCRARRAQTSLEPLLSRAG